jgi:hypothetical protein
VTLWRDSVIVLGEIFYSCDTAMIRYVYPHVKKHMDLWQLGEDGLVQHRAGGWGIGPEGYGGGSYNHGWAGGPLTLLSEYVAGVAPIEPGYKTFHVMPQLGHLKSVKVVVPTIKGDISVSHQLEPSSFTTTLNVPQHTKAVVGIPVGILADLFKIEVNGILVK